MELAPARKIVFYLFLLSLYTNLGATIMGKYVGGSVASGFGILLLVLHLVEGQGRWVLRTSLMAVAALIPWAFTIFLSPDPRGFWLDATQSFVVLFASVFAAIGAACELRTMSRAELIKLTGTAAFGLIFLCCLEVYTPFRNLSEAWRQFAFSDAFLYDADDRDLAISGSIRPKLFTQEPSHVGKAIGVALGCWFALTRSPHRTWIALLGILLAFYVCGTPTLLLAFGIAAAAIGFSSSVDFRNLRVAEHAKRFLVATAPVVLLLLSPTLAQFLPFDRAQMIANGEDVSVITRTQGPMLVAYETASRYPLSGAGIGGRELVADILYDAYASFPGYPLVRLYRNEGYAGWGNAFFEMLSYTGIVMSLIIFPFLALFLRRFHPSLLLSGTLFFIVFNFDGGFGTVRPWGYFAIVVTAFWIRDRESSRTTSSNLITKRRASPGTLGLPAGQT